jgi:hypothetical protein
MEKSEDYLNNLVQVYWLLPIKKIISENTQITTRLKLIMFELDGVEQDVESFKKNNKLTDIKSEVSWFQ